MSEPWIDRPVRKEQDGDEWLIVAADGDIWAKVASSVAAQEIVDALNATAPDAGDVEDVEALARQLDYFIAGAYLRERLEPWDVRGPDSRTQKAAKRAAEHVLQVYGGDAGALYKALAEIHDRLQGHASMYTPLMGLLDISGKALAGSLHALDRKDGDAP